MIESYPGIEMTILSLLRYPVRYAVATSSKKDMANTMPTCAHEIAARTEPCTVKSPKGRDNENEVTDSVLIHAEKKLPESD